MSISQNFPTISPSLSLNFARSKTLDPRITFIRTTAGTRTNELGLIEVVPANAPRFDHSYENGLVRSLGLLIEEQRSNLLLRSGEFDTGNWGKSGSSIISNQINSPDGTLSADKLIPDTSLSRHYVQQTLTITANTTYTVSCFAKSAELNFAAVIFGMGSSPFTRGGTILNLTTGEITNYTVGTPLSVIRHSVEKYSNGWWRISVSVLIDTTTTFGYVEIGASSLSTNYSSYTGDGTSGIYIWGAQLEQGSFPTSYIPTTNSTSIRTVDAVSMTGTNFSSWFNQSEGTLFANFMGKTIRPSISFDRYIAIVGNDPNFDEMGFYTQTADGGGIYKKIAGFITNNAVGQISGVVSGGGPDFGGKAILAYKSNDASYTINGATPVTDNTVDLPTFVGLRIFGRARFQPEPSGHISQFIYYPKRLPDVQLINLTK